jgi:ubiquinone/menaquinone biosynthesis C-methylase UbiE
VSNVRQSRPDDATASTLRQAKIEAMSPIGRDTASVGREFDRQARRAACVLDLRSGRLVLDVATGSGLAARSRAEFTGSVRCDRQRVSLSMLQVAARVSGYNYLRAYQRILGMACAWSAAVG